MIALWMGLPCSSSGRSVGHWELIEIPFIFDTTSSPARAVIYFRIAIVLVHQADGSCSIMFCPGKIFPRLLDAVAIRLPSASIMFPLTFVVPKSMPRR